MGVSSRFRNDQICKYYSKWGLVPAVAGSFVEEYATMVFEFFTKSVDTLFHGEGAALLGYYTADVKIDISEHGTFWSDKGQETRFIESNILLFELCHDILCYEQFSDIMDFLSVFGKYCKLLTGDAGPEFSDWVQNKKAASDSLSAEEERSIMLRVLNAFSFVIFHEFAHMQSDTLAVVLRMMEDEESLRPFTDNLSPQEKEEIACDYIALYTMTCTDLPMADLFEHSCSCSGTDTIAYGLMMLNADRYLDLLKCCFSFGNQLENRMVNDIFSIMNKILINRFTPLLIMLKLSQNTQCMHMTEIDIEGSLNRFHRLTSVFLDGIIGTMKEINDFMAQVSEKKGGPAMIVRNDPIPEETIWYLVR